MVVRGDVEPAPHASCFGRASRGPPRRLVGVGHQTPEHARHADRVALGFFQQAQRLDLPRAEIAREVDHAGPIGPTHFTEDLELVPRRLLHGGQELVFRAAPPNNRSTPEVEAALRAEAAPGTRRRAAARTTASRRRGYGRVEL